MIESVILCALFVYGAKAVINGYCDFFGVDLDDFYEKTNREYVNDCIGEVYNIRPQWQKFILKPTIYCNVCMSSFWGSIYYWAIIGTIDHWFFIWPLHLIATAAIITLLNKIPE